MEPGDALNLLSLGQGWGRRDGDARTQVPGTSWTDIPMKLGLGSLNPRFRVQVPDLGSQTKLELQVAGVPRFEFGGLNGVRGPGPSTLGPWSGDRTH